MTVEKETPLDVDTGFLTVTDPNPIDEDDYKCITYLSIVKYVANGRDPGPTSKITFKLPLETASNLSLPHYSHSQHMHHPTGLLQNCPHQQHNFLVQNRCPNPNHLQNGSDSRLPRVFNTKCEIGENGTRRSRSGLIDGEEMEKIKRKRPNGLQRLNLMLVCLQCFSLSVKYLILALDADFDPVKAARDERKSRVAKNEKQRLGNLARAPKERDQRKQEIDTTLASTRISTASMGKFDKKLDGEKKLRGVKRKVTVAFKIN